MVPEQIVRDEHVVDIHAVCDDGLMIDPPKFGRGPDGEVWKLDESLPDLLRQCRLLLSDRPLFVILSCYAIRASALSLYNGLSELTAGLDGRLACGEMVGVDAAGRGLSHALSARWSARTPGGS